MRECAKTLHVKNVEIWETENEKKRGRDTREIRRNYCSEWKLEKRDGGRIQLNENDLLSPLSSDCDS